MSKFHVRAVDGAGRWAPPVAVETAQQALEEFRLRSARYAHVFVDDGLRAITPRELYEVAKQTA